MAQVVQRSACGLFGKAGQQPRECLARNSTGGKSCRHQESRVQPRRCQRAERLRARRWPAACSGNAITPVTIVSPSARRRTERKPATSSSHATPWMSTRMAGFIAVANARRPATKVWPLVWMWRGLATVAATGPYYRGTNSRSTNFLSCQVCFPVRAADWRLCTRANSFRSCSSRSRSTWRLTRKTRMASYRSRCSMRSRANGLQLPDNLVPEAENCAMRMDEQEIEAIAQAIARHLSAAARTTPKRLLSLDEAGEYIGRTSRSVRALIASHQFPGVEADRRVFVDREDLDKWIERSKK